MIIIYEGLSIGLIHGVDVGDGLRIEQEGEPQSPKLEAPYDHFRLQIFSILLVVKRNA